MLDSLYERLADATGREVDDIRADARAGRFFNVAQAVEYGLIEAEADRGGPGDAGPRAPRRAGPP
jgi:ATP-dependent protease ClpP protease subunit